MTDRQMLCLICNLLSGFNIARRTAMESMYTKVPYLTTIGGEANFFFKVRKFLGSFRYRKTSNFLCMPVRKSQVRFFVLLTCKSKIRKFLQNIAQLCK